MKEFHRKLRLPCCIDPPAGIVHLFFYTTIQGALALTLNSNKLVRVGMWNAYFVSKQKVLIYSGRKHQFFSLKLTNEARGR